MFKKTTILIIISLLSGHLFAQGEAEQLLTFPLQWKFSMPRQHIILTSDQQLLDLMDPDKKINTSLNFEQKYESLREIREKAKQKGASTVILAFDNFFRQYRKDVGAERKLYPDSDEYIARIKKISEFFDEYDIGLELSLLSPLELGPAFTRYGGEPGKWVHFKTDIRDPETGKFSIMFWEQLAWSNNKGKINLKRFGVRAFAFKEKRLPGGDFFAVNPDDIIEITSGIEVEEWAGTKSPEEAGFRSRRLRIFHKGDETLKGYDKVFVILNYTTPEMDYFSPKALPFLKDLMQRYYDAGINLNALYSDEMHIQQDWSYFGHHDNGQFALRYLTQNMIHEYAKQFGAEYSEMDKYMLYFVSGSKPYLKTTRACRNSQIVMGESPEAINKTFLLRDRYYKLLNHSVVDLFVSGKQFAEKLYGKDLLTRAHATWAQSPTIDDWATGLQNSSRYRYEYTSNFVWSNSVHQAAAACYDNFKWGEYLTGNGTDHPEGGWSDRNYYGSAFACSIGLINKYPNAYNGFWGMPAPVHERIQTVVSAFGANATRTIKAITENVHRDVDVLMLYPMNLVASEERFGSWMTQYGYTNYITAEKLLEMGEVTEDGGISLAGRTFKTLIAVFENLPQPGLLEMMGNLAKNGGNVIWSGSPPVVDATGENCQAEWQNLFGVIYKPTKFQGEIAAGKSITFKNKLSTVPEQVILTDFFVDRIYPVELNEGSKTLATIENKVIGASQQFGKGVTCYLGFRPRDDQSASLGKEQRTWFEILNTLGAYPPTGNFVNINDNTEFVSRTSEYLTTRFPNGTTIIASHYRNHPESWPGGFARDKAHDEKSIEENPLPSDKIHLKDFKVNGHEVIFNGRLIMAFNTDQKKNLFAFEGHDCNQITIDGKTTTFASEKQEYIAWAPIPDNRQIHNKAFYQIFIKGSGEISIPIVTDREKIKLFAQGKTLGSMGKEIFSSLENGLLKIKVTEENSNRWLYLVGSLR